MYVTITDVNNDVPGGLMESANENDKDNENDKANEKANANNNKT